MGSYVKSISDKERIINGLIDLKEELSAHKAATKRNNRELEKINEASAHIQQKKIIELEEKIRQMKEDQKWVKSEKPAIDVTPDNLMKKLNII